MGGYSMDLQLGSIAALPWEALLRFTGILYMAVALHVMVMALFSFVFGLRVKEISIGTLIPLIRARIANVGLSLKAVPTGGYVQYHEPDPIQAPPVIQRDHGRYFRQLSPAARIAISLSGCLALLLIAFAMIGDEAFNVGFAVWAQFLLGAFGPFSTAQTYLADLSDFIQTAPAQLLIAVVFAKVAALNLLPVGALNGGIFLQVFLEEYFSEAAVERYFQLSLLVLLPLWLSWLVAIFYFLF